VASTAAPGQRPAWARGRHLVGPLLLLGAGVVLLLNNLQIVPWSIWRDIWPYWPVVLILLGLEAIVTGRVAWGTLVLMVLLLPLVGLSVAATSFTSQWQDATRRSPDRLTGSQRQPLGSLQSAAVDVEYGAGALDIGPLPAELAADTLADAQVYGRGAIRFENASPVEAGRGRTRIGQRDEERGMPHDHFAPRRLDVRLSPSIPIDLRVSSGVSETTLRLQDLQVPNLRLETGVSNTHLYLPARGETSAQIEAGAAGIEITVPPNVAARIILDGGPNRVQIDERRFPRRGDEYRSPTFDTATDRVTLRIEVGASRLVVQ
jgi:hypothetical protein